MLRGLFYWTLNNTVLSCNFWLLVIVYFAIKLVVAFGLRFYRQSKFPPLVKKRREECDKSFQYDINIDDIPQTLRDKILQSDLLGLRQLIWSQEISAEKVLKFFFYRSKTIGRELNAAIEGNFAQALQLAKEADQRIKSSPQNQLPPLLGLPFSVKENYYQKGFESTQGMETRLGGKLDKTAPLIEHLIKQGAIPFVRSNIPQALMAFESENPIFGKCANPHDKTRTSGGSSGGEASLIAGGCSPAGIGNDIGGSIRIPSSFSGIFGFKPSAGRLNVSSQITPVHPFGEIGTNQDYVKCCNGPMAKSVSDLQLLTEEFCAPEINHLIQRSLPPLPWRKEATQLKEGQKLTIGYFESADEVFECHTAGKRAVREVVEALKKQGHTLVKVDVPYTKETFNLVVRLLMTDGFMGPFVAINNGMKLINAYRMLQISYSIPYCIKVVLAKILGFFGKHRMALVAMASSPIPAQEIFVQANGQLVLTSDFLKGLQEKNIQYLISPGFGVPAVKHETSGDLIAAAYYTLIYNLWGLPAGTLPITRVRKDEQTYESAHDDIITTAAKACMADTEGLPVGVQVAALPYKDEECLALMQHIEKIMNLKPFLKV